MNVRIENLIVEFKNGVRAIDGISLEIENGIYGLLGENGAGKTTLMRVLTTVLPITAGKVYFDNVPLIPKNYYEIQKNIGYLPQELNLYPQLKVRDALEYIGKMEGMSSKQCKSKIDYLLERTNLQEHQKKRVGQLSGGMKRRVGLIQAMLNNPKVLIVDEPTTGLDPEERIKIRNLLSEFAKERVVLFSTHVTEDISSTCKNLAIMKKGKIIQKGTVAEITAQAKNHVKTVIVQEEEADALEKKYTISEKRYVENGIELKIINPLNEMHDCEDEKVSLEDAYMVIMGNSESQN